MNEIPSNLNIALSFVKTYQLSSYAEKKKTPKKTILAQIASFAQSAGGIK